MMNDVIDLTKRNKKNTVGAIIQARMTSKRFPGKSMAILKGVPVIENVIRNVQMVPRLDKIILAVPDTAESEPLLKVAERLGIENFCGSEDDVLSRYYNAARFFDLDVVMRITGDCPFINPDVCHETLQLLMVRRLDYCSNSFPVRTYPRGMDCEVFTMDALEAAHKFAVTQEDREHVTPWMQRTPGLKRANVLQHTDASNINLCVDLPEDIARLEVVQFKVGKVA